MPRLLAPLLLVFTLLAGVAPAPAVEPDEILDDPKLEQRARDISHGLRCLVCQNQSIDDSNAPLAKDLRVLVRQRLKAGDSDAQVVDYVVARYGEFVLLRPRFEAHTLLLWLGPLLVLTAAAGATVWSYRRRRRTPADPATTLSAAEKRKLKKLLGQS